MLAFAETVAPTMVRQARSYSRSRVEHAEADHRVLPRAHEQRKDPPRLTWFAFDAAALMSVALLALSLIAVFVVE